MKTKLFLACLAILTGLVAVTTLLRNRPKIPLIAPTTRTPAPVVTPESQVSTPQSIVAVQTPKSNAPLSVVPIVTGTSNATMAARWKAVESLGNNLSVTEVQGLFDYLKSHEDETNAAMRGVLKNEVMLALKSQNPP